VARWIEQAAGGGGPRYIAIVEALAAAIASGELGGGERIPTQRELARMLGLTPGTAARAYAIAAQRGLIAGETGRGTFVRREAPAPRLPQVARYSEPGEPNEPGPEVGAFAPAALGDLALPNVPAALLREALAAACARLARDFDVDFGRYHPHGAQLPRNAREVGRRWLAQLGKPAELEDVALTPGAQAALYVILYSPNLRRLPVLTAALTYSGLRNLGATHGRTLVAVESDRHGLLPASIDAACRRGQGRLLYLQSAVHNPTCVATPLERRREIVEVARRFDLVIVEDNAALAVPEQALPPVAALAPERTFLISSTGKCIGPALPLGCVATPPGWAAQLNESMRTHHIYPSLLNVEAVGHLLASGILPVAWQETREVLRRRAALAGERLAPFRLRSLPDSPFAWLELPESWSSQALSTVARTHGLAVGGSQNFAVGAMTPGTDGLRLSLTGTSADAAFAAHLERLRRLLEPPGSAAASLPKAGGG